MSLSESLSAQIRLLKEQGLYRSLKEVVPLCGKISVGGSEVVDFSSNDYLGLSGDERLACAVRSALDDYGVGAGASRLISGNYDLNNRLEQKISEFKKLQSALVFPTGYMANLGVITSLVNSSDDLIVADRLIHASLVDACRASGATFKVYEHNCPDKLEKILNRYRNKRRILVVTDGVFSMDGDIALLKNIGEISKKHSAWLMVDDAHGTGVLGDLGSGSAELFGVSDLIDIHMGTLSKACGVLGGFVAGDKVLTDYLVNKARSFIYTTGIPPILCVAAIEAINIIQSQPWRRERLRKISVFVRKSLTEIGFNVLDGITPIIPVIIGDNLKVMEISHRLFEEGFFVAGIRYPTVPKGESRLRISLKATHSDEDINRFLSVMKFFFEKYGYLKK